MFLGMQKTHLLQNAAGDLGSAEGFIFSNAQKGQRELGALGVTFFFSLCLLPSLCFWSMQNNVSALAVFIPWFFSAHFALASCFPSCLMDFA